MNNGHWQFPLQMDSSKQGFIYLIIDNENNRGYIGKKNYGRSERRRIVESEWRNYKSSSNELLKEFETRGISDFTFICLEEYNTKAGLAYAETWSLMAVRACFGYRWYNTLVPEITWNVTEDVTQRHKERLALWEKSF